MIEKRECRCEICGWVEIVENHTISCPQCMSAFQQSVHLTLQLHALRVAGKDESPEADALREESDSHWLAMTPVERDLIRSLAASLAGNEPQNPPDSTKSA